MCSVRAPPKGLSVRFRRHASLIKVLLKSYNLWNKHNTKLFLNSNCGYFIPHYLAQDTVKHKITSNDSENLDKSYFSYNRM